MALSSFYFILWDGLPARLFPVSISHSPKRPERKRGLSQSSPDASGTSALRAERSTSPKPSTPTHLCRVVILIHPDADAELASDSPPNHTTRRHLSPSPLLRGEGRGEGLLILLSLLPLVGWASSPSLHLSFFPPSSAVSRNHQAAVSSPSCCGTSSAYLLSPQGPRRHPPKRCPRPAFPPVRTAVI